MNDQVPGAAPRIVISYHAGKRAMERFGAAVAAHLDDLARNSRRTAAKTKDGLHAYKHDASGVVFLMLEKQATSLGGLYELEAVTVITTDMLERMRTT